MDKYIEEKYKNFLELPNDYDEQTLRNLFVKRCYSQRIDDSDEDEIIIETEDKVSTFKERMALKGKKAVVAFQFPPDTSFEGVKHELDSLKPSEIDKYSLRKKVKAYLKICRQIGRESIENADYSKPLAPVRVASFILAEAYYRGEVELKDMPKEAFKDYVSIMFPDINSDTIFQAVRSTRKGEKNVLLYYYELKIQYSKEYKYAMKIFKDYYPDLPEIKSK